MFVQAAFQNAIRKKVSLLIKIKNLRSETAYHFVVVLLSTYNY